MSAAYERSGWEVMGDDSPAESAAWRGLGKEEWEKPEGMDGKASVVGRYRDSPAENSRAPLSCEGG